ncbi:unnamed protein product [Urochloa humidicola]
MATMPASERKRTACVTGGNGYIASALIKTLLEKGYAVKATVRNPAGIAKNSHLKELPALGSLEVVRADLGEEGSFDEAVAGCIYVFLVAAPVNVMAEENPERAMIDAAVHGTLNVLRSCVKAGTVKRVILTSSTASVYSRPDLMQGSGYTLDERSWSDAEYLRANKPPMWSYGVSKVLLEKAACRFADEHGVSLVTLCPALTIGAAPAPNVQTSVPCCLSLLSGDEAAFAVLRAIEMEAGTVALVHVDDVARAELFLAEEEALSGGRYICCSHNSSILELARFLGDKYPQYTVKTDLLRSGGLLEKPRVCLSSEKLIRDGFVYKYKTLEQMYDDVVEYGKALEILPN